MAPDLNAIASKDGKWDYTNPGSGGYNIPNISMHDPSNRHVKVLTIGAGVSGIMMAYQIQKYCENVTNVVYEKNEDIGGTWLENRYPGAACDIPSHAYTMNFALNAEWPKFFSESPDIWTYLDNICHVFDLRKYMTFDTEVIGCYWQETQGQWLVKLRETKNGQQREFEETCDLLLHGTGILNNYKWPSFPGLDTFKGKVVHTARWPSTYQSPQWKSERVAIIGSGASSIQTVPTMQPHVAHMDIFVRTGVWFIDLAGHTGVNTDYKVEEKAGFKSDPASLVEHAKGIEDKVNGIWGAFYSDTPGQTTAQEYYKQRMSEHIKDERLLKGFTPSFGVGCRRVTPGDPYMAAIQKPNVNVHFTPVVRVTPDSVIGADGTSVAVDTIVCATGFDVSYRPRFPIVGQDGVDLAVKWKEAPEGYLGLAVPGFPNFLTFIGPTWPVENGSVMGPLLSVSEYAIQAIRKLQFENLHSFVPKQDVTDAFNSHAQEWIKHTVWKESCRAWYRDNDTGRVNAVWPGASLHYQLAIRTPRWEDYNLTHRPANTFTPSAAVAAARAHQSEGYGHNPFAYLGMGFVPELMHNASIREIQAARSTSSTGGLTGSDIPEQVLPGEELDDVSPYLNEAFLDWRWLAGMHGMGEGEAKEYVIRKAGERAMKAMRAQIERREKGMGGVGLRTSGFDGGDL